MAVKVDEPVKVAKRPPSKPFRAATCVVNDTRFTALTAVLTVFALTGDDVMVLCFDPPADPVFTGITIFCIVAFCLEIILSCVGRSDYFGSFFFILDVASTVTLLLDLEIISDTLFEDSDLRSSRTARAGSKFGRVARVLRLVRILKLYKALYDAQQRKRRKERAAKPPGEEDEDDWDDIDVDRRTDTLQRESHVGKRLSELTIRKVIILVLCMMLVVPLLSIAESEKHEYSAYYSENTVLDAFKAMLTVRRNESAAPGALAAAERSYHLAFLQNLYYHNWYTQVNPDCDEGSTSRPKCFMGKNWFIYWVGIRGSPSDRDVVEEHARLAMIPRATVDEFEMNFSSPKRAYGLSTMPEDVKHRISGADNAWYACEDEEQNTVEYGFSVIKDLIPGQVDYAVRCPVALRNRERVQSVPERSDGEAWNFVFWYDSRPLVMKQALNSLELMTFVCIALCSTALFFSNDANTLVLHPVEKMIAKVETIRDNPLMAMKLADDEFKLEEIARAKREKLNGRDMLSRIQAFVFCVQSESVEEPMETVVLEKTIIKLGSLLALGFGEAGTSIIEHNMSGVDSACVDAMVEGTRVECIIGATTISNFGTATQVLQGNVMRFVNQIAEIVHGVVDELHGAPNKNNGDTFLMIWRTHGLWPQEVAKLADMSIIALARILGSVHRSRVLADYRRHPGLQQRLGRHFRVTLTSGLHYGWAIEGAVGSEFKIDASYLSPNVSIAETIERATAVYGVNILATRSLIDICTPEMAMISRILDCVVIVGSTTPMELYSIDLDQHALEVEPLKGTIAWNSRQRFKARQFLEAEKAEKLLDCVKMVDYFNQNPDIVTMRFRYTVEFLHVFNMGFQNYRQGEWQVAQRLLSKTRSMLGMSDGPSTALLRFMEKPHHFQAPEWWQGVRKLDVVTN